MAVRNFYVRAEADGRASSVGVGPARKDGGMSVRITQRSNGTVAEVARLDGIARSDGSLLLRLVLANPSEDVSVERVHTNEFEIVTQR